MEKEMTAQKVFELLQGQMVLMLARQQALEELALMLAKEGGHDPAKLRKVLGQTSEKISQKLLLQLGDRHAGSIERIDLLERLKKEIEGE